MKSNGEWLKLNTKIKGMVGIEKKSHCVITDEVVNLIMENADLACGIYGEYYYHVLWNENCYLVAEKICDDMWQLSRENMISKSQKVYKNPSSKVIKIGTLNEISNKACSYLRWFRNTVTDQYLEEKSLIDAEIEEKQRKKEEKQRKKEERERLKKSKEQFRTEKQLTFFL